MLRNKKGNRSESPFDKTEHFQTLCIRSHTISVNKRAASKS
ncbi:hypothetical protein bcere0020_55440 [Bacillus cereus Rock3-29]|nr:hypothetical protein bcere0020_55440 [Bacillus cereus Rock3-29]